MVADILKFKNAIENNDIRGVKGFINSSNDVNVRLCDGITPLMYASAYGHAGIAELFLSNEADIEAVDELGYSALMHASANGQTNVVKLLLCNGADISVKNDFHNVLMLASLNGHMDLVKYLLAQGISVSERSNNGGTALMSASWFGHTDIAEFLLSEGAGINDRNVYGGSALICAAISGHLKTANLLISHGADVNHRDNIGRTPLWYAIKYGHNEMADLLIAKGSKPFHRKTYKVCFAGIQHPASMELIKGYFRQCNEFSVIESLVSGTVDLIKTLIIEKPDVFFTCNDTSETYTKISALLNIPKIRFQEDPPQNPKWSKSFLYDIYAPSAYIYSPFELDSFGHISEEKLVLRLLESEDVKLQSSVDPPLSDYFWLDPKYIKDSDSQEKNIDIVFVGNIGIWTAENLRLEAERRFKHLSGSDLDEIISEILFHAGEFQVRIPRIEDRLQDADSDMTNALSHFYYEAIGRLRRVNILRSIVSAFDEEYDIHLYGHENIADYISRKHYKGYLYNEKAINDIFRRSRLAVYCNSRPPLYNYTRFIEPYRFACAGIVDYLHITDSELKRQCGLNYEIVRCVPKIRNLYEIKNIIPFYMNDENREALIEDVLRAGAAYSRINVAPVAGKYMYLFEYLKSKSVAGSGPKDILKYDSEVISLCDNIITCYSSLDDKDSAMMFTELRNYYLNLLSDGYQGDTEKAFEYASYYFLKKDYERAMTIIADACSVNDKVQMLKAKVCEKRKEYGKIIDILSGFTPGSSEFEVERLFMLGIALHNQNRLHEAMDKYEKVSGLNAEYSLINYYKGLTMYCMNDMHEAKRYLQEAFRKTKDFPDIGILLGDVYFKLREYGDSVRIYEYALGVVRTYEKIKEKEVDLIEKLSLACLFNSDIESSAGYLDIIIRQYDWNHLSAHLRLFLLLLSKGIFNKFFSRELAWLQDNNVSVIKHYSEISSQFPREINDKIVANVLNLNTENSLLADFRQSLKGAVNQSC